MSEGLAARAQRFLRAILELGPQYPNNALLRAWELAHYVAMPTPTPFLDLGCGDGSVATLLFAAREQPTAGPVIGLDVNRESLRLAATRGLYSTLVRADARALPLPDRGIATVFSVCVLEHIPEVDRVLAEVARVLALGGTFAFSVPLPHLRVVAATTHPADPDAWVAAFDRRVEHLNYRSIDEWSRALAAVGLTVEEVRPFMPTTAAVAWFEAYDWTVRPVRGRGVLYRLAGHGLRRLGVRARLLRHWTARLDAPAAAGVGAAPEDACAALFVCRKG